MKKLIVIGLAVIFLLSASLSSAEEYTVKKGDCLSKIGEQFEAPWRDIAKVNKVKGPKYTIYIGHKLAIPRKPAKVSASTQYLDRIRSLRVQIAELEQKLNQAAAAKTTDVVAETGQKIAGVSDIATAKTETPVKIKTSPVVVSTAGQSEKPTKAAKGRVIGGSSDVFDAIMGGGYYEMANGSPGSGTYLNGRLRARPFLFSNIGESGLNLGLGLFGHGSIVDGGGFGRDGKFYPFHKRAWDIGPTGKLYGNGWDMNLDLGVGQVREYGEGHDETQNVSSPFMWYSNYLRRLKNEPWLAKTEVGAGMIIPFSGDGNRDMRTGELYFTQWIYDWKLDKDIRLSAGLETSLGYSKSGSGSNFYRFGPALSLEYKNQSIFTLGVGYKEKLGADGDLWLVNGSLNVGNVIKLIKASYITKPTAEDLQAK